ncbi:MAG: FtsW/RodA/SpoVE family cell cycle protein [Lachnospiraceae bacterium]|nr:FtsW/RodA/SpoVE family cell cycle protein [Lachnospiraceae bacterium]
MQAYAVSYSKYLIAASMVLYTFLAYVALPSGKDVRRTCETLQRLCIGVFTINAYLTMAIIAGDEYLFTFGLLQLVIVIGTALLNRFLYKSANMLMVNNIMMMLSTGLVMISRINHDKAQKQLLIALAGMLFMLLFPLLRSHFDALRKGTYLYGIMGIGALAAVLLLGAITNGSKLSFTIAGLTFQPSEFVKILFLLFMASALCEENSKSHIALLTGAALVHIGILVVSRDLGSALIFFVIYLALLFLSTGKWEVLLGGVLIGLVTAVLCYFLFAHVRVRVQVFLDPWSSIDGSGYQITQALFAISFGGLFGAGLMQGMPSSIPFVESDFIFAAIIEEMGIIFGICLILLCLNIFTDFLLLAGSYSSKFYRLYTFGAAIAFIFQAFLTIGGEVKFIPLTGVTLPLVSYGGSSVLATFVLFSTIGAIFMLQDERMERFEKRYEAEHAGAAGGYGARNVSSEQTQSYGGGGDRDQDFYRDFKGVPIYDPGRDYENTNHFDV